MNTLSVKIQSLLLLLISSSLCAGPVLSTADGDLTWGLFGKFAIDTFYGENINLFNSSLKADRVFYNKHKIDFGVDVLYGQKTFGAPVAEFKMSLRNKGTWGNASTIVPTTEDEIKLLDARLGAHKHYIPRQLLWIREAWLEFDLSRALSLNFCGKQTFKLGAFPFELGRGIALGDAYATGQGFAGFFDEGDIDQYAFGAKLGGDLYKEKVWYDLYVAILQNKSTSFSETGANIYGQEINRLECPQRGFGYVDFVVASHLLWKVNPCKDACSELTLEPYILYNYSPEQTVEFTADAYSKLTTVGFAAEYVGENFEFGFDTAFNAGAQYVRGWDRNGVEMVNMNGKAQLVNSHVYLGVDPADVPAGIDISLYKAPFTKAPYAHNGSNPDVKIPKKQTIQTILDNTQEGKQFNGDKIGQLKSVSATEPVVQTITVDDQRTAFNAPIGFPAENAGNLYNATDRYRDPYTNKYRGGMFVGDIAWWACDHKLRTAFTAGVASGDDNPNFDTVDGVYSGFLPLQEGYSGKRVKSAFVLGGASKIKRPLSAPTEEQAPDDFAPSIGGFTDLILVGGSLTYASNIGKRKFEIMPNVLAFWKYKRVAKFDALTNSDVVGCCASKYLGTEINMQSYLMLFKNLKITNTTSVFFPGQHYKDRRGLPLNKAQDKELDNLDKTGFDSAIPNLGNSISYTINFGLEYSF